MLRPATRRGRSTNTPADRVTVARLGEEPTREADLLFEELADERGSADATATRCDMEIRTGNYGEVVALAGRRLDNLAPTADGLI